jgi:hypothetical protein
MKKGCFIKGIILLTIIVASITYIIQNKFNDFIFTPGKKLILPIFVNDFKKNLKYVKDSPQKDSLNLFIKNYLEDSKNIKELSDSSLKPLVREIYNITSDSVISPAELKNIKDFIRFRRQNERSEKN